MDQGQGLGMNRWVAEFPTLTMDGERHDAPALHEVFNFQGAEFSATQTVVEEDGENGSVPLALERGGVGGIEQLASLFVGDGRGFAFIGPFSRPFDAVNGIDNDSVLFAEVIEEVGQRGEFPANRGRRHTLFLQRLAPGDDVGSSDDSEVGEVLDANELHELPDVIAVGPPGVGVGDVGEPFGLRRHIAEALELGLGDETLF